MSIMIDKIIEWKNYDWKEFHNKIFRQVAKPQFILLGVAMIFGLALFLSPNFSNTNNPPGYIIEWADDEYCITSYFFCFVYFLPFTLFLQLLGMHNNRIGFKLLVALRINKFPN